MIRDLKGWEVGAFFESSVTAIGDEASDDYDKEGQTFVSFLGGVRTSLAF